MEPRKYVAYNQTRDSLLSSSVTSVNAGLEPLKVLKVLIEGLPANSRTGLWLTNFKGVPVARTLSPFDLVYLDKDNRVVQGVELSKDGEFAPSKGQPASALVLPSKSLTTSRTKEGDQLELRVVELEAQPEQVPAPVALPPTPADLAPSQPIEPSPAEPSPSARFFSSGASAVEAPISSAEFSQFPFRMRLRRRVSRHRSVPKLRQSNSRSPRFQNRRANLFGPKKNRTHAPWSPKHRLPHQNLRRRSNRCRMRR